MKKIFIAIQLILFSCYLISTNALAADAALKRVIGFSEDGKYLAFEQYGIQDGSGFGYVDIFFINNETNEWVKGAPPIRIKSKDENTSLAKLRATAIKQATAKIKELGVLLRGFILVSNPITQLDAPKYTAHFGLHPSAPRLNQYQLRLNVKGANSDACARFGAPNLKIFDLTLMNINLNRDVKSYKDTNLPRSRGCALDYTISDVHYFEGVNGEQYLVTFINILKLGFEGNDRRFMVIPFKLK